MTSRLTTNTSFLRAVFQQLLQFSRQRLSFSAHRAALTTKTDLIFLAFSSTFIDFASQVWQWREFPRPITILSLRIVTNEIASFGIDNRLRQMAFFRLRQSGQRPAFTLVEVF